MPNSRRPLVAWFCALSLAPAAAVAAPQADPVTDVPSGPHGAYIKVDCPGPNCPIDPVLEPQAQGLRTVYLNFDGVTLNATENSDDATQNNSRILVGGIGAGNSATIPPFNPSALYSTEGKTRAQIISQVVSEMYDSHAPYNVEFVTERPTSGVYSMVVFGGSCQSVAGQSNCAGIALLDCGDFLGSNVTYVFPGGLRVGDLATTAAQEEAHAFGLSHTTDTTDIMYPYIQNSIPSQFGAGPIPADDDPCGDATYQDSDEMMMQIIGYRGQDTTGPTITITAPLPGAIVDIGAPVNAEVTDASAITKTELAVNGIVVAETTSPPWSFTIPEGTEAGDVNLVVRSYDDQGNYNQVGVNVYILSGNEEPCGPGGTCDDGFECTDGVCVPGDGVGGLGSVCTGNEECNSGICATSDGEMRCSQQCSDTAPCPSGFDCRGGVACWPSEESDDEGGGCAASGQTTGGLGLIWLAGLAVLILRRRRAAS